LSRPAASGALPRIVWLASYPKSGNTWLRFLLGHLLGGPIERSDELGARVPDAHKIGDWTGLDRGRVHYVKTHWAFDRVKVAHRCEGAVQIVRNPFDVLAASFNFYLLTSASEVDVGDAAAFERLRKAYVERFIQWRGDLRWLPLGAGSWQGHVRSWIEAATGVGVLRLRYEDLLARPGPEVARLVAFLGLDASAAEIERAVARSSFGALRALEEREIGARQSGLFWRESYGAGHARGRRFVNRGAARFGQDLLTAAERARIARAFRAELELLGYADAAAAVGGCS
jgi:Sulfotransferase domain